MPNFQVTQCHDGRGNFIEHDTIRGDMLDPGSWHVRVTVPLNTPRGQVPLNLRVPLIGAADCDDAFARLPELIDLNLPAEQERELGRMREQARLMMLRQQPPLIADSPNAGRRK